MSLLDGPVADSPATPPTDSSPGPVPVVDDGSSPPPPSPPSGDAGSGTPSTTDDDGGHFLDQYRETHPDLITDNDKRHKDVLGLLKNYKELEKMAHGKGLIPPGPDSTPEEVAAWNQRIGVPESAADYGDVEIPEELAEIIGDADVEGLRNAALELGLRPDQFGKLKDVFLNMNREGLEVQKEADAQELSESKAALEKAWGDQYPEKIAGVKGVLDQFETEIPGLFEELTAKGLGKSPKVMEFLDRIASEMGNDSLLGKASTGGNVSQLESRILELEKKQDEMLPGAQRRGVTAELQELYKRLPKDYKFSS